MSLPSARARRRGLLLWGMVALLSGMALAGTLIIRELRLELFEGAEGFLLVQSSYLQDQPQQQATTGWLGVAAPGLPVENKNFAGGPLTLRGTPYAAGIGTYPLSQITYRLDGRYLAFLCDVGVDDAIPAGQGQTRFLVYGDGLRLFDSGIVRSGEPPRRVRVAVSGVNELRLVAVDETGGAAPGLADWAEPRLVSVFGLAKPLEALNETLASRLQPRGQALTRDRERQRVSLLGRDELRALQSSIPAPDAEGSDVVGFSDPGRRQLGLANEHLVVTFGVGGERHGQFAVFDRKQERYLLYQGTSSFSLGDASYNLAQDTLPPLSQGESFARVEDPVLGLGRSLTVRLQLAQSTASVQVELVLYQRSPYLTYQFTVSGAGLSAPSASFNLLDYRYGRLVLGENVSYLTDYARLRHIAVADDGLEHRERVGEGKPVFIAAGSPARGIILAALDETAAPAGLRLQIAPGEQEARVEFSAGQLREGSRLRSPRFYLELITTPNTLQAFSNFRRVITGLYPPLPMPAWARFQWNSWYTYYMDISESELIRQIDYIADNLLDLGPWHIEVDAGWYVAEGREYSNWKNIDLDKFPSGLRPLVDYAHSRGVKVVLYFSAPYLDNRDRAGNWLGLRQVIEQHPEWLIKTDSDVGGEGYVYDFSNPELRNYIEDVLADFFYTYNVDGIEVDGLGTVEPVIRTPEGRDGFGLARAATDQTMDIYRFIYRTVKEMDPQAYVFAGWHLPLFANSYSHSFWYSDELPVFSNPYPYGGLQQHLDYALLQQGLWGQHAHMGFAYGDPNRDLPPWWWVDASLAAATQISLGFDLPSMSPETLSWLRERLHHYRPFQGQLAFSGAYPPEVFATQRDGIGYLGVINRELEPGNIVVRFSDIGLDPGADYLVLETETHRYFRATGSFLAALPGQSFQLYLVTRAPGVVWTNSSVEVTHGERTIWVDVHGPESINGFVELLVPEHPTVHLDGEPLDLDDPEWSGASYDAATGVLRLTYGHEYQRTVEVQW